MTPHTHTLSLALFNDLASEAVQAALLGFEPPLAHNNSTIWRNHYRLFRGHSLLQPSCIK